ncbi:MAG: hypothetical protein M0C28_43655 [Candidatus Moduliflexus flocculans]|nr:hypothetical protein [Candidatus Moduliflexus flocculans]
MIKKPFSKNFSPFFDRAKVTFESTYNEGEVDFQLYQEFRRTIYEFGDDAYWLLLGVEKYADVIRLRASDNPVQERSYIAHQMRFSLEMNEPVRPK